MSKSQKVREYIKGHPWSTNAQIALATYLKTNDVAAITTYDFKCKKLIRKEPLITHGHPCFIYALPGTEYVEEQISPKQEPRIESREPTKALFDSKSNIRSLLNMDVVEKIADDLSNIIIQKVCEKLQEKLAILTQSKANTTPEEFVSNLINNIKQPKSAVLIVGLLPQQAGLIQTEFGEYLNLRFWKDGSLVQLKNTAKQSDFVLLFTSKISHDASNAVASVNNNVIRVAGGMTTLREKLTEIFCEN